MGDALGTDHVMMLSLLPVGVLTHMVSKLPIKDQAMCMMTARLLRDAATVALKSRRSWHTKHHDEVSHMKASRLFKFLARYSPHLTHISCYFASDRLYGGSLLEGSLGSLAQAAESLTRLTILNVDVTDTVLQHFAQHCPALQHIAIGRTENNAFGNFVSDEGIAALAAGCKALSSLCLFRCYSCSDAGLRELVARGRAIKQLVLHSCPQITAAGLAMFFESTPGLEHLDILPPDGAPGIAAVNFDTCFALAANCSKLRVLRLIEELLSRGVLDDSCLNVVARGCTALQALELVQIEVSDSLMSVLAAHCTQLTSLRLEQTYVGDEGVQRVLSGCPGLRELRVAGCSTHSWMLPAELMFEGLSVAGFTGIATMVAEKPALGIGAQLTALDFSCVSLHQPEAMEAAATAAAAAAAAASVAMTAGAAAAAGTAGLAAAVAAAEAACNNNAAADDTAADIRPTIGSSSSGISDEVLNDNVLEPSSSRSSSSLDSLLLFPRSWCVNLTSLSLNWLKVDPESLQAPLEVTLAACPSLTKLSLIGYQGSVDRLLAVVAGTRAALTHLNLQHSQVTDVGLAALAAALPRLTALYLCYCRHVGDTGLLQLLELPLLEELDLYNTPCVSIAAVARLARCCKSLQQLYIGHSTSALHRLPAAAPAMGYIRSSSSSNSGSSSDVSSFRCSGTSGLSSTSSSSNSVWCAVNEAAACRVGTRLAVLCRNPSSESEFERRTLQALLETCNGHCQA